MALVEPKLNLLNEIPPNFSFGQIIHDQNLASFNFGRGEAESKNQMFGFGLAPAELKNQSSATASFPLNLDFCSFYLEGKCESLLWFRYKK